MVDVLYSLFSLGQEKIPNAKSILVFSTDWILFVHSNVCLLFGHESARIITIGLFVVLSSVLSFAWYALFFRPFVKIFAWICLCAYIIGIPLAVGYSLNKII